MASSLDVIAITALSTFIGTAFYIWGLLSALSEHLHAEQFEIEIKNKGRKLILPTIFFVSIAGFLLNYYIEQYFRFHFLYLPAIILFMEVYYRLPIWKYIENKASVGFVIVTITFFSMNLGVSVAGKIQSVASGEYKSSYEVIFKTESKFKGNYEFVASNSVYVFLWNKSEARMHVIARTDIAEFLIK